MLLVLPRTSCFLWVNLRCYKYLDYIERNDELERICKEAVVAYLRYYHSIFVQRLKGIINLGRDSNQALAE
jgi:hypothetical protein